MAGAVRYANASGAHNVASTWDGGLTVPSAGDTVYMNARNVTGYAADFDLTTGAPDVNSGSFVTGVFYVIKTVGTANWTSIGASAATIGIGFFATGPGTGSGVATAAGCITNRPLTSPAINVGGNFACGDGRTLKANCFGDITNGTNTVLYVGYSSTTITGNIYPSGLTTGTVRVTGGTGTLIVNGNIKTATPSSNTGYGIVHTATFASLILNGNIETPATSNSVALSMTNGYNLTINGTIVGGGIGANITCTGTVTIMGPLVDGIPTAPIITGGGGASGSYGVVFAGSGCTCTAVIGSSDLPGTITGGSGSGHITVGSVAGSVADLTIYANIVGGAAGTVVNLNATGGRLTLYGNVTAANGGALGISNGGIPTVINGNVTGSATAAISGLAAGTAANYTINGNVTGGAFAASYGVNDTGGWYGKINGDVFPGAGSTSFGINSTGNSAVLVVNGTAYASNATTGTATHAMNINSATTAYIMKAVGCNLKEPNNGIVINFAVNSAVPSRVYVRKTQSGTGGFPALPSINSFRWADNTTYTDEDVLYTGGSQYATLRHRFGDAAYVPPTADKVRTGVTFAFGDVTGTMTVPSVNSVRKGVNVDTTIGTAFVSASDVWSLPNTITADAGGLLTIIKTSATPAIAASITSSYDP